MSWLLKMRKLCEKWRCLRCLKISVRIEANFVVNNRKKVLGRGEEISLDDVYEHNFPILTLMLKFRTKSCTLWTCAWIRKVRCSKPTFLSKNWIRSEFSIVKCQNCFQLFSNLMQSSCFGAKIQICLKVEFIKIEFLD